MPISHMVSVTLQHLEHPPSVPGTVTLLVSDVTTCETRMGVTSPDPLPGSYQDEGKASDALRVT